MFALKNVELNTGTSRATTSVLQRTTDLDEILDGDETFNNDLVQKEILTPFFVN